MRLIIDARALQTYPVGREGFSGGTEHYLHHLARGLFKAGHMVHVVTPDLEREEWRQGVWYWPAAFHPTEADAVIAFHNLAHILDYEADLLVLAPNGVDPWLGNQGEMAAGVDAFACLSEAHADLLAKHRPTVDRGKCFVTGLGVDLNEYGGPVPDGFYDLWSDPAIPIKGRMLYANNPANGLWHVLDIFDAVKRDVPEATLHLSYDFERQFAARQWEASQMAELLWECRRRVESTPGVVNLGALDRELLVREQLESHVYIMPQDSENPSTTIHSLVALESAAAGTALVLSDCAGYREVFGAAATILPLPGTYLPALERRYDAQDWAEAVVQLMKDSGRWQEESRRARAFAERQTWERVVEQWDAMLAKLGRREAVPA